MQFSKVLIGKLLPLLAWEVSMIKHIFRAQNLWWLLLKNQIFGIFRVLAMCSNLSGVDTPNYMFIQFLWVLCLKSRRFSTRTQKCAFTNPPKNAKPYFFRKAHLVKWILNLKQKIGSQYLVILCISDRQKYRQLKNCPGLVSFFVNPD